MTRGTLLDTHALLWLREGARLKPEAIFAIGAAIQSQTLFLSQMFLWELALSLRKNNIANRPDLGGLTFDQFLADVTTRYGARLVSISDRIAVEAAHVPAIYGQGDPGDCFLIATAHVENLTLVTRDAKILELAHRRPDYLSVIAC